MMDAETSGGSDLYHEEVGDGAPILLIHPSGSTRLDLGLRGRGSPGLDG